MTDERLQAARAKRRATMGDAYVDSQTDEARPALRDLQDHLTLQAWGAWAREGSLSTRDRSLLVLAMTAAMGRLEEFELHARTQAQTGVTDDEIDELLFMIAGYCGGPAALGAKRAVARARETRGAR